MSTLGVVITRQQQQVMLAISIVRELTIKKLSELLGVLAILKTQLVRLWLNLSFQLALLPQKLKALHVQFITLALSIKAEVTSVLTRLWAHGLQLATTVRQTPQHAYQQRKLKQAVVDKTKLAQSPILNTIVAQTLMDNQFKDNGNQLKLTANQHHQHVMQAHKKER